MCGKTLRIIAALCLPVFLTAGGCEQRRSTAIHVYQLTADVKAGHVLVQTDLSGLVVPALPRDVPAETDSALIGTNPITRDDISSALGRQFANDVVAGTVLQRSMLK
jgi:hypothetical protein